MNEYSTQEHASAVRIAGSHGYRIDGDVAFLNAELDVASERLGDGEWALQLWACHEPYSGGRLSGVKIAETPVRLGDHGGVKHVTGEAIARVPVAKGEYSMVLVVARRSSDALEQVHDFANYPARESFVGPHFDGSVGYALDGDSVTLRAERVQNPRPAFTLSGGLTLELWALRAAYTGSELDGLCVASAELGAMGGQFSLEAQEHRVPFVEPPAGDWHLALVLRERMPAAGPITRDFCNFPVPFRVEPAHDATPAETAEATPSHSDDTAAAEGAEAAPSQSEAIEAPLAEALPAAHGDAPAEAVEATPSEAPKGAPPVESRDAARAASRPHFPKVSIQTATLEALMQVKGISKKIATEIIRSRPFQSLDDLLRVRGIGEKLLRKLRPYLTL